MPLDIATRFWNKVHLCNHGRPCETCCWIWQAGMCRGYGVFSLPIALRPGNSKVLRASRVCWWLTRGAWPESFHVLHTCDNPPCVQPAHLWLGTIDDNQKDSMRKGRRPTGDRHGLRLHPEATKKGANNYNTKLNPDLVRQIRTWVAAGHRDTAITRMLPLPVHPNTIRLIRLGINWKHIPKED